MTETIEYIDENSILSRKTVNIARVVPRDGLTDEKHIIQFPYEIVWVGGSSTTVSLMMAGNAIMQIAGLNDYRGVLTDSFEGIDTARKFFNSEKYVPGEQVFIEVSTEFTVKAYVDPLRSNLHPDRSHRVQLQKVPSDWALDDDHAINHFHCRGQEHFEEKNALHYIKYEGHKSNHLIWSSKFSPTENYDALNTLKAVFDKYKND